TGVNPVQCLAPTLLDKRGGNKSHLAAPQSSRFESNRDGAACSRRRAGHQVRVRAINGTGIRSGTPAPIATHIAFMVVSWFSCRPHKRAIRRETVRTAPVPRAGSRNGASRRELNND